MPLTLSLDQSTSATKAVLFTATGEIVDKAVRQHRQLYPRRGWVEHDAEEIWQNAVGVLRDLRARQDLSDVTALSIANQRETIVVFERGTAQPLYPAIVWQCRRGEDLCRLMRESGIEESVRAKTGLKLEAYFSASKIAWLIANEPALAAKLRSGAAVVGTIDTYLIHRLTRGAVFATDPTNASRTLLFDVTRLCWDSGLCELFSVPLQALAEVRESTATFGKTDACGVLPRAVPIVGVMGDSQASLFAQRCFDAGSTKATFGTGTSVLMNIGSEFRLSEAAVTALAWVLLGRPTYAFEGLISFSAATLTWLKGQLKLFSDESEVEALALGVEDNGGVYLVPAFAGLSSPHWAPQARAALLGMTAFTRREHVVRAGLESIAYQLRDVLDAMTASSGQRLGELRVDGGPTTNEFLMQFTADVTGVPLRVAELRESSAWGAALSGLLGLGAFSSLAELAALPCRVREYSPRMPVGEANHLHDGWLAAVARVL